MRYILTLSALATLSSGVLSAFVEFYGDAGCAGGPVFTNASDCGGPCTQIIPIPSTSLPITAQVGLEGPNEQTLIYESTDCSGTPMAVIGGCCGATTPELGCAPANFNGAVMGSFLTHVLNVKGGGTACPPGTDPPYSP